jgi:hypothetical protein
LKAGITRAIFHVDGNMPFCNEKLKIIAKGIQMVSEVHLMGDAVITTSFTYFQCLCQLSKKTTKAVLQIIDPYLY